MADAGKRRGLGRRAFLHQGTFVLTAATLGAAEVFAQEPVAPLRIGLLTDLHYADKSPRGTRHYRETLDKLAEVSALCATEQPAILVELGDLIDAAESVETELNYLKTINRHFAPICNDRHYVLGNHGVKNCMKVRHVLEESKKIRVVFQGHRHKNDLTEIGGIHYCTLHAMVEGSGAENNGYAILNIESSGTIRLDGFRKQSSYQWEGAL